MNISKITKILSQRGYSMNTWTTLDDFTHILLSSDNKLILGRNSCRVRFDSNGVLFIQNYDEKRFKECTAKDIAPTGYINVQIGDKHYLMKMIPGYINTEFGPISTAIDFDFIMGFSDESINVKTFK